jgi:hypothetical protein
LAAAILVPITAAALLETILVIIAISNIKPLSIKVVELPSVADLLNKKLRRLLVKLDLKPKKQPRLR